MASWAHFGAPGTSKWSPPGAAEVALGAQCVQFRPLWVPKVFKMEPCGTTMAAQSGILEPVGNPFDQMLIWFSFFVYFESHVGAFWRQF